MSGSEGWVYLEPVVPGVHPTEALTVALAKRLDRGLPTLRDDLTSDSARGLHLVAQLLAQGPETRVVLAEKYIGVGTTRHITLKYRIFSLLRLGPGLAEVGCCAALMPATCTG